MSLPVNATVQAAQSYDVTNCMLLAAIPGRVGDGGKVTVSSRMTVGGHERTGAQVAVMGLALVLAGVLGVVRAELRPR